MTRRRGVPAPWACAVAAGVGLAAAAPSASAQTRSLYSVTVPVEIEHDSNPNMAVRNAAAVTRVRARPEVTVQHKRDEDELLLKAAAVLEHSTNPAVSADRFDPRLQAEWRREGARSDFSAFALVERSAFRAVEVSEQVPLGVDGTRTLRAVGGSVTHRFTAATSVTADARHDWVGFDQGPTPDYRLAAASARLVHVLSARNSAYLAAAVQAYRPITSTPFTTVGAGRKSDSAGVLVGYRSSLTEAFEWEAALGAVRVTGPVSDTSPQGIARIKYMTPRIEFNAQLSRRPIVVAEEATVAVSDVVHLQLRYQFAAETALVLDADASRADSRGPHRAQQYAAAVVRELTPTWSAAVRLQHRRRQDVLGIATANVVALTLTYTRPDF